MTMTTTFALAFAAAKAMKAQKLARKAAQQAKKAAVQHIAGMKKLAAMFAFNPFAIRTDAGKIIAWIRSGMRKTTKTYGTKFNFDILRFASDTVETPKENFDLQRFASEEVETPKENVVEGKEASMTTEQIQVPAATNVKRIHIRKADQVARVYNAVKSQEQPGYNVPSVILQDSGNVVLQTIRVDSGLFTEQVGNLCSTELLPNVLGTKDIVGRTFMGQLYLQYDNIAVRDWLMEKRGNKVVGTKLYAVQCLTEAGWDLYLRVRNRVTGLMLLNLQNGNLTTIEAVQASGAAYWAYDWKFGKSSPGQLKKNSVMLFGEFHKNKSGITLYDEYDREEAISVSNSGSWKIHEEQDTDGTPQKIAKFMTRMAQDMTRMSTRTEKVPCPAVLISPNKGSLVDTVLNVKFDPYDGLLIGSVKWLLRTLNESQDKFLVHEEALLAQADQGRVFSVSKGVRFWTSEKLMRYHMNMLLKDQKLFVVDAESADEALVRELALYMQTGGKESQFAGAFVLIIWPSAFGGYTSWGTWKYEGVELPMPALVTDFNGLKTGFDIHYKSGLRIMNNAHKAHGIGRSSVQSLQTIFAAIGFDAAADFIYRLGQKTVNDGLKDRQAKAAESFNEEGQVVQVEEHIDWLKIVDKIAPTFGTIIPKTLRKGLEKKALSIVNKINCSNYDLGTKAEILIPDLFTAFSRYQVLQLREVEYEGRIIKVWPVFCKDLKPGQITFINRFPKAGSGEFLVVIGISEEEYREMALAAGCPKDIVEEVIKHVGNMPSGMITIPASPMATKLLGGADYDGDKALLYVYDGHDSEMAALTKEFVSIVLQHPMVCVDKDMN